MLGRGRESAHWALVSKPDSNRLPGRPRESWKNNIGIDFQHTMMVEGREGEHWNYLAHSRDKWRALGNTIMKLLTP